jgi:hypothetical protein
MAKYKIKTKEKLPELKARYDERSKYDWLDVRAAFIEGTRDSDGTIVWPSVPELAKKYSIPEAALRNRVGSERWRDHRQAHQNQLAVERQKEHAKVLAKKAVKFDEQAVEASTVAQQIVLDRLYEIQELKTLDQPRLNEIRDRVEQGEIIDPRELRQSVVGYSELESLAKAFNLFNEVGRKALGLKDGETAGAQTNIQINQITNVAEQLRQSDEQRNQALLSVLQNSNLKLPGITTGKQEEILEGEIVDDDRGTED